MKDLIFAIELIITPLTFLYQTVTWIFQYNQRGTSYINFEGQLKKWFTAVIKASEKKNTMTRLYRYCLHKQFEKREIESSIPEPEDEFNWITESSGRLCWRTPRNPVWLASFDEHELGGEDFEVLLRRRFKGLDSSVENNDKFNFIGLQTASNDSIDSPLEKKKR